MIDLHPLEIKVFSLKEGSQPAKGRQTESEGMHIKKCKLARGVKAKKRKTNGRKTMTWRVLSV